MAVIVTNSNKIINKQHAIKEFQNFSREWNKNKNEMVKEGVNFFKNGVFPFTINYCPFLEISESLLFLGRLQNGLDMGVPDIPPIRIICVMLFHSVETFEKKKEEDLEKQKFNLYWNNLFNNEKFISGFLELDNRERLVELISETHNYLEKRRYQRYSINTVAYCHPVAEDTVSENKSKVAVKNISQQGILFEHNNPYKVNNVVEISLMLDDRIIYIVGKVCRINKINEPAIDKYETGINFTHISAENQLIISKYLNDIQSLN